METMAMFVGVIALICILGFFNEKVTKNKLNARIYATVQNPFVISPYKGLDPEISGGIDNNMYPRSMTTVLGVSLQF